MKTNVITVLSTLLCFSLGYILWARLPEVKPLPRKKLETELVENKIDPIQITEKVTIKTVYSSDGSTFYVLYGQGGEAINFIRY